MIAQKAIPADATSLMISLSRSQSVWVNNLKEASEEVNKFLGGNGWGSSEFYRFRHAGKVYSNGVHIATVSYNGRVWDTTMKKEIVFDGGSK